MCLEDSRQLALPRSSIPILYNPEIVSLTVK